MKLMHTEKSVTYSSVEVKETNINGSLSFEYIHGDSSLIVVARVGEDLIATKMVFDLDLCSAIDLRNYLNGYIEYLRDGDK